MALALTLLAAIPAEGADWRVQAELPKLTTVGEKETLTVRLLSAIGTPTTAARDLAVTVQVEGEELSRRSILSAGASELAFHLTARKPAAYTLEVVVEGLDPVWIPWIVVSAQSAPTALASVPRELRQMTAPPLVAQTSALRVQPPDAPEPSAEPDAVASVSERGGASIARHPARARAARPPASADPDGVAGGELPQVQTHYQWHLDSARAVPRAPQSERLILRTPDGSPAPATASPSAGAAAPSPPLPQAPGGEAAVEAAAEAFAAALAVNPAGHAAMEDALAALDKAVAHHPGTDAAALASGSELRFHAPHMRVWPGADGAYSRPLFATWFVNGVPAAPPVDVSAVLAVVQGSSDLSFDPQRLLIPATTDTGSAVLTAARSGRAEVRAFHPLGATPPVVVELLPPEPVAISFVPDQVRALRRLGPAEVSVAAELFGEALRSTTAPTDLPLRFSASDGVASVTCSVILPAGQREAQCMLTLTRFGDYTLTVRAPGLPPTTVQLAFGFDFALLGWVFVGGLIGATVQVARRRVRGDDPLIKTYLLGAAAGITIALLLVFGSLALIGWILPTELVDAALGSSQTALFLIGLLGGFAGEGVFAAIDRRLRPAPGAPSSGGSAATEPPEPPEPPPLDGGGVPAPAPPAG